MERGSQSMGMVISDLQMISMLAAVPTPCTPNGGRSMSTEKMDSTGKTLDGKKHTALLEHAVKFSAVAIPRSEDSQCAGAHRGTPDTLHSQAHLSAVATPTCPAPHDSDQTAGKGRPRKGYGEDLAIQANQYDPGVDPDGSTRSRLDQLPRQAQLADSGLTATGGTDGTKSTGQLDPAYSRWLMGVPPEWDGFAYTAMQSVSQQCKRSSKAISKRKDND
jgi:hypothetical protein